MTMSRRKVLLLTGGGFVLAAAGAAAGFAVTRDPVRARQPWLLAGGYGEPRLNALSWALLAPNPHNLQPWRAELVGADAVLIHRDRSRRLPETDPHDRQLTIGMGAFLELMIMAAGESGHGVALSLFPDGPTGPVARATFRSGEGRPDPLFRHAAARRSCKRPFEDRLPPAADLAAIAAFGHVVSDPTDVARLRALTWDAWMTEVTTANTYRESVDLMRFGRSEIEANPDGISLGGTMLEALMLAGVLTRQTQLDPASSGFRQGVGIYQRMLAATPAYVALTTAGNAQSDQIEAGRRWLRLNLEATARGLALHPVSQCLQEFPKMAAHHAHAHLLLAKPGETVQMLGRLGYGPSTPPAPRWRLEARLTNG